MSELLFKVMLKGDGSGLVGQTRLSTEEVRKLTAAVGASEKAAGKLTQATGQMAEAEVRAAQAAAQLQAAQARGQTAAIALAKAQDAVAAATGGSAEEQAAAAAKLALAQARVSTASAGMMSAQQRLAQMADRGTASVSRQQFAMRNLGYQIGDIGTQLSMGTSPFLIFGMQATQVTGALADMGGKVGAVGRLLSGPWGAALVTAISLAGMFGSRLFEAGEAAEAAKAGSSGLADAQSVLGEMFDLTSGKIKSQNALLIANARLTAINLREDARKGRESAGKAMDGLSSNGSMLSLFGTFATGGFSGVQQRQSANYSAFTQLNNVRLASTDAERQKAVQRALSFSETADFKGMDVTAEQFRQAVIDLAAAAAKDVTASEIDKALDSGALPASLKKTGRTPKSKSLDGTLSSTLRELDPLASIQNDYEERLKNIDKLAKARLISDQKADQLRLDAERRMRDERIKLDDQVAKEYQTGLERASSQAFKDMVNGPVRLLGESLETQGERIGKGVEKSLAQTLPIVRNAFGKMLGTFGVGSGLADLGEKVFGGKTFDMGFGSFRSELKATFKDIFKADGEFGKLFQDLGDTLGQIGAAAGVGVQIGGLLGGGNGSSKLGGAIGGVLGKEAGKLVGPAIGKAIGGQLGSALGSAAGPLGAIAGSVIGSLAGGLLSKTKKGVATLGNVNGEAGITGTSGNSASRIANATKLGNGVTDALQSIIDQLGGSLGNFSVSVGQRKNKFVVDPTGSGRTKGGGVTSYADEQEAAMAALADAIADGAVKGLSPAVSRALKSSSDVDKAVREALKVQQVEELLGGIGAAMESEFRTFEKQAAERVRIAKQYGFDLVKLEEINAKERADMLNKVLSDRIEPLKSLLDDLATGDLSEGTAADRRQALLKKIDQARTDAEMGKDGASSTYADLRRQLLSLDRQFFGTAGEEYSADRATTQAELEALIKLETERAQKAQQDAQAALQAAKDTATGVDETNDKLAELLGITREMVEQLKAMGGIGAIASSAAFAYRGA